MGKLAMSALLAAGAVAGTVAAQPVTSVLKERDVTEAAIVEALRPASKLPPGVKTRSIRVAPAGGAMAAAQRPASAAVLITFATNSSQLTESAKQSLDVVARALNNDQLSGLTFEIEGHADPRGDSDYNLRLSQARAESVRDYLINVRNVSPDRLRAIGKGDRELMNPQVPAAAENRRVTFVTLQ